MLFIGYACNKFHLLKFFLIFLKLSELFLNSLIFVYSHKKEWLKEKLHLKEKPRL